MKNLVLALATATTLGFASPVLGAQNAPVLHDGITAAHTDLSSQRRVVKKVVVRHGPGWYRGPRAAKRVVIKRRPNGTTVRNVFRNGRLVKKVIRR